MLALINKLRRYRWGLIGRNQIKKLVRLKHQQGQAIKIILGSSDHNALNGEWINTDIPQFDITDAKHWASIFGEAKIENLFAEHVMEHLSKDQIIQALNLAKTYLKDNGVFRIAIPDSNNQDAIYREATRPGGSGPGAHDHKVFLNLKDFEALSVDSGFSLVPLEYCDEKGAFHFTPFDTKNGDVQRSKNKNYHYPEVPAYTSLVIDLIKPAK